MYTPSFRCKESNPQGREKDNVTQSDLGRAVHTEPVGWVTEAVCVPGGKGRST